MQIKKFIGNTLKEATLKMKEELGTEAIILGTRIIEGNAALDRRRMFEITGGLEEENFTEVYTAPSEMPQSWAKHRSKNDTGYENERQTKNFASELDEISMNFNQSPPQNILNSKIQNQELKAETVENEIKEVVEVLYNKDVHKRVISSVMSELKKYKKFLHSSNLDNYILSALASMIPVRNIELKKSSQPKVMSFVGPTGVGKTTCIAKLSVIAKILHNLDIGLISLDTYRLGAIDQLKIFSEITKTDLLVAYEPDEVKKHMNTFKKKDLVFVDTAGRSPKNTEQLKRTKEFLDVLKFNETFLVLSTTNNTKCMMDAAEKFELFDYSSFIFTKIDEAVTYGSIINLTSNINKPVAYLSNGQTIPDDIISADSEFIASMIYTGNYLNVRAS